MTTNVKASNLVSGDSKKFRKKLLQSAIFLGVMADTSIVYAAQTMEEILVSARKRDETLFEVPVAVSVVSAEQLQKFNTTDVRDLQTYAPGLLIESGGTGAGGNISIRGINTSTLQTGFEQAVSVAIDGVQVSRPRILAMAMMDVQQVEVLRGPQALFFGKNSPAGVISLKTANPTEEFEGSLRASYEFEADEVKVEAVLSGPLNEDWGARLALSYRDMDGFYDNSAVTPFTAATFPFAGPDGGVPPLGDQEFGEDERQGRLTLSYDPSDSGFSALFKIGVSEYEGPGPAVGQGCYAGSGPNQDQLTAVFNPGLIAVENECQLDHRFALGAPTEAIVNNFPHAAFDPYSEVDQTMASVELSYDVGDWVLTSLSGYYDMDSGGFDNFDAVSYFQIPSFSGEKFEMFSQELRLTSNLDGPVNYMLGLFYQDSDQETTNHSKILPFGPDPIDGFYQSFSRLGFTDGETISMFGQLIWDITEKLELSVGARYTDEEKDSSLTHTAVHQFSLGAPFFAAPVGEVFEDSFSDSNLSPEVTLNYRLAENVITYIGYKTGFKSGGLGHNQTLFGYNPSFASDPAARAAYISTFTFDSEEVDGFEIGVKAQFLDNRLAVTGAIYSYDYTDLQVTSFDAETTTFGISNAAAATVEGVEVEVSYQALDNLRLYGSLNYNDATYDEFISTCYLNQTAAQGCNVEVSPGSFAQDLSGESLTLAPEITGALGFEWNVSLNDDLRLDINTNARFSDEYSAHSDNDPRAVQDSYWAIDAGVRLSSHDDKWQVGLIGRNLADELYTLRVNNKPGGASGNGELFGTLSRGRQYVLEVNYRF